MWRYEFLEYVMRLRRSGVPPGDCQCSLNEDVDVCVFAHCIDFLCLAVSWLVLKLGGCGCRSRRA